MHLDAIDTCDSSETCDIDACDTYDTWDTWDACTHLRYLAPLHNLIPFDIRGFEVMSWDDWDKTSLLDEL